MQYDTAKNSFDLRSYLSSQVSFEKRFSTFRNVHVIFQRQNKNSDKPYEHREEDILILDAVNKNGCEKDHF